MMAEKMLEMKRDETNIADMTTQVMNILEAGKQELPTIPKKERQEAFSTQTRGLLQQSQHARDKNNFKAYKTLNWRFRKSKKEDRTKMIMDTLDKDLDIRDKWLGIRQLKQEYQPHTYARTTKEGQHIPQKDRAQKAAEYLAKEQWGKKRKREEDTEQEQPKKRADKIRSARDTEEKYNTEEITMEEIWETIKKFKRRKAPGPDEIPMELFQVWTTPAWKV